MLFLELLTFIKKSKSPPTDTPHTTPHVFVEHQTAPKISWCYSVFLEYSVYLETISHMSYQDGGEANHALYVHNVLFCISFTRTSRSSPLQLWPGMRYCAITRNVILGTTNSGSCQLRKGDARVVVVGFDP